MKEILKDKYYVHLDTKKHHKNYERLIKDIKWVKQHGFYPFIHFNMKLDKYIRDHNGDKYLKHKRRDIYYSAHIDRFIYEYYGNRLNDKYNIYAKKSGIDEVSIAYRNCKHNKSNIDFAKEVFEFIVKNEAAYIFVGDFSEFFDTLDHKYLKTQIKKVNGNNSLDDADYAIFKNLTRFTYVEMEDIEKYKKSKIKDMRHLTKYFDTEEFQKFKKNNLKKHTKDYGIPQGSAISSIYANIYMIDFDKNINHYISKLGGIYRRYSDDIIIVVPTNFSNEYLKEVQKIQEFIFTEKDKIKNLKLNKDKTKEYFYENGKINNISGKSDIIDYLGFCFDGCNVSIREKSVFKFYYRAYKKIKKVNKIESPKSFNAGKKAVYRLYTHLGNNNHNSLHGNFITYAYKADSIFSKSKYLKSNIRKQVKRHWNKISNKLKKI